MDYLYGWTRSGPTHYDTAKYWFKKSADQSLSAAQNELGYMHATGWWGTKHNCTESYKWYRWAANQGNRKAKYNLGRLTLIEERCCISQDVKAASDHIKYYIAEMVGYTKIRPISDDQNSVERWSHEYNQ